MLFEHWLERASCSSNVVFPQYEVRATGSLGTNHQHAQTGSYSFVMSLDVRATMAPNTG